MGNWFGEQVKGNTVILDLYELDYINSLTVGYLANIYNVLYARHVRLQFIVSEKGLIYQILEQVGFMKFPGIEIKTERTYPN